MEVDQQKGKEVDEEVEEVQRVVVDGKRAAFAGDGRMIKSSSCFCWM